MHEFFYRYIPRFTKGICRISFNRWGNPRYTLLTGDVHLTNSTDSVLAEVEFLNVFGYVLFPKVLRTLHQ